MVRYREKGYGKAIYAVFNFMPSWAVLNFMPSGNYANWAVNCNQISVKMSKQGISWVISATKNAVKKVHTGLFRQLRVLLKRYTLGYFSN